jgi:hypothetical protein
MIGSALKGAAFKAVRRLRLLTRPLGSYNWDYELVAVAGVALQPNYSLFTLDFPHSSHLGKNPSLRSGLR